MVKKYKDTLLLLIATLIWGFNYSVQTLMSDKFQTNTIISLKLYGGLLLLAIVFLYKIKINKKTVFSGIFLGIVSYMASFFQQKALENTTVSKTSFLVSLYIVFVPIISLIFLRIKPKKKIWLSILIAIVGMYFLCNNSDLSLSTGDIYAIASGFCFATQMVLIGVYAKDCDATSLTAIIQITLSLIALVIALFTENIPLNEVSNFLPHILFVSFFPGAIALLLQVSAQSRMDPSLASLTMSFESVFGAMFGYLVLGQQLSLKEIFGCILILAAVLLAE